MQMSNGNESVDECEGGYHPSDTLMANVWNMLACKEHAGAEMVAFFLAATLLYGRLPWRARPASRRAEKR